MYRFPKSMLSETIKINKQTNQKKKNENYTYSSLKLSLQDLSQ
jgi:hypothetical protein